MDSLRQMDDMLRQERILRQTDDMLRQRGVLKLISILREQGLTILVVEQNVRQTLEISDYAYVLESGRMVMEGTGNELLNNSRLVESFLGLGKS